MYIPSNLDWEKLLRDDPVLARPLIPLSFAAAALVALFAPTNVLERHSSLAWFANQMSRAVPSIRQWAVVSEFPEVTQLFFALAWILAPFQAFMAYRLPALHRQMVAHWRAKPAVRWFVPLLVIVILPLFLWGALTLGWETTDCVGVCLGKSRAALALVGGVIPVASALAAVVIAIWLRRFQDIYLS